MMNRSQPAQTAQATSREIGFTKYYKEVGESSISRSWGYETGAMRVSENPTLLGN